MLFGNPADFAIEAEVEPDLALPSPVLGRLRVWCRQTPLGNFDEAPCNLSPAFVGFQWRLGNLDSLWADDFLGLDDMAAWKFLDAVLYGYDGTAPIEDRRTAQQIQADWLTWRRFNFLTNWGSRSGTGRHFCSARRWMTHAFSIRVCRRTTAALCG